MSVIGVPTYHDAEKGAKKGRNTVYLIEIDDVRVCHLGDLGHSLDDTQAETLSSADVLLVPVGGHSAINAAQAAEVVRQLEPRYVVPMHYAIPGLKLQLDPIDRFLKEIGLTAGEPQPKLSVQTSSGPKPNHACVALSRRATQACATIAPFGLPVDPEV